MNTKKLHLYLGRFLAFFIMFMALSGSILLYKEELIGSSLCIKDKSNILNKIAFEKNINSLENIKFISFFKENYYYKVSFLDKEAKYFSSKSSFELDCKSTDLMGLLSELHYTFFVSKYFIVFIGILACFLLLSGVFLVKKYKIRKILQRKNSFDSLHIKIGIISSSFLFIYILSGSFLPLKKDFIKTVFSNHTIYPKRSLNKSVNEIDFIKLYNIVENNVQNGRITRIYFPKNKASNFIFRIKYQEEVHPNGKSYISLNPTTKEFLEHIDARKHPKTLNFIENIYTFHSGKYENRIYPVFLLLVSFVLLFLSFRGIKK